MSLGDSLPAPHWHPRAELRWRFSALPAEAGAKGSPNHCMIVARCDGRIVGHAAVITYDRGASHELMVFVHPDFQDAGIEAAVTDDALRLARREGIDVSHLLTPTFSMITSASRTGLRAVFGALFSLKD